jgi:hypothetical protein
MERAADRLILAPWNDPRAVFAATGETLWWVTLLDDELEDRRRDTYKSAMRSGATSPPSFLGFDTSEIASPMEAGC